MMNAIIKKKESTPNKNKISVKLPKVKLGTGRLMAEIDYDAVFGNVLTK